ncbi:hypothetical protein GTW38_14820 [Streptomyces sp. SID7804]|nr:hypothetical protein [Streptomyces sp. SID7804]
MKLVAWLKAENTLGHGRAGALVAHTLAGTGGKRAAHRGPAARVICSNWAFVPTGWHPSLWCRHA